MAFKKVSARQELIVAYIDFVFGDLVSAVAKGLLELPENAVVVMGEVIVDTAWDSVTSDALIVGDTGVTNRYKTSFSIAATGRTALVPTGYKTTAPSNINVTWTGVGTAPTHGAATLMVGYYKRGRSEFTQGLDA